MKRRRQPAFEPAQAELGLQCAATFQRAPSGIPASRTADLWRDLGAKHGVQPIGSDASLPVDNELVAVLRCRQRGVTAEETPAQLAVAQSVFVEPYLAFEYVDRHTAVGFAHAGLLEAVFTAHAHRGGIEWNRNRQGQRAVAAGLQTGRQVTRPRRAVGAGGDAVEHAQGVVDRPVDRGADVHLLATVGKLGLYHHIRGGQIADAALAGHAHLVAVDRHVHLGLAHGLPSGEETVDAVTHLPADFEFPAAGREWKLARGAVVQQLAFGHASVHERVLHPGEGFARQVFRRVIARGMRAVEIAEVGLEPEIRRARRVVRQAQPEVAAGLAVFAREAQVIADNFPVIGAFFPTDLAADLPRRERPAEHLGQRQHDLF